MNNLDVLDVGQAKNGFHLLALKRIHEKGMPNIDPGWFDEKIRSLGIYNYAFLVTWMDSEGILFIILKHILKIDRQLYLVIPNAPLHLLLTNLFQQVKTVKIYQSVEDFEQRRK
jgi:hypothetical protein